MRIQNKIMLGAVIFVLCAAAAYAQVSISSIPVTQVRNTGRAELAGDVRVTAGANITLTAPGETFTIRYGVPITNGPTYGLSVTSAITGTSVCGLAAASPVDYTNGIVTVTCTAGTLNANDYFQLVGVRVSVDGFSGTQVSATIGALKTTITAGQQSAVVIEALGTGLVYTATTPKNGGTSTTNISANQLTLLANGTNVTNNVTNVAGFSTQARMFLKEGFASAWKNKSDEGAGATNGTQILLTISGLPSGVSITPTPMTDASSGTSATLYTSPGGAPTVSFPNAIFGQTAITGTYPTAVITIQGESLSAVETLEIDFSISVSATAALPLAQGNFTATATLTPNDPALTSSGLPYDAANSGNFFASFHAPKFAVSNVSQQILTIVTNSTNLLIPYATTAANYDTGLAVANTTTDPFGASAGGATPQKGTITFNFYPNDGTTIAAYTTVAGSPGSGLDASGNVASGNTYVVLLSQLLKAAAPTRTTPFSGYIIAVVGAPNVHAIAFVSDFTGKFTSFSPALIIPNTGGTANSATSRTNIATESLGF